MGIPDILIIVLLTYYSVYCIKMLVNSKRRLDIQIVNKKLDDLRKKPLKSLDDQKKFLDLKYPKTTSKFKFHWMMVPKFILNIGFYILMFYGIRHVYNFFGFEIKFWQAIIVVIVFPLLLNLVLERFDIQKGDLRYLLRW